MKLALRYPFFSAFAVALVDLMLWVALFALVFFSLRAFAHAPPLEQLPDAMLAQVAPAATPELEQAAIEATHTESLFLKILAGLLGILSPLLVTLVAMAVKYLNEKGKDNKVLAALGIGTEIVHTFVAKAEVELRPQLQAALADGRLSDVEAQQLKAKVMEILKRDIPGPVMATLGNALGPALDGWLSGKVEQAVAAQARPS